MMLSSHWRKDNNSKRSSDKRRSFFLSQETFSILIHQIWRSWLLYRLVLLSLSFFRSSTLKSFTLRQFMNWTLLMKAHFCLRPSAKDQGITWVLVVVLLLLLVHHLVHFLLKRNLSEKNSPRSGIEPGSFSSPAKHFIHIVTQLVKNCYLT